MTATHNAPHKASGHGSGTHVPEPLDPERDIDARTTTIWVLISAVVFFVSFYFLLPMFDFVMTTERTKKIDNAPTTELNKMLEKEHAFLDGKDNQKGMTIEKAMAERAKK